MAETSDLWKVEYHRHAERALRRLPRHIVARIRAKCDSLAVNPRPPDCVRLTTDEELYRVRVGKWRIIYTIQDDLLIVLILDIPTRGHAYRDL